MQDTMQRIHQLANERFDLFRLAGKQHLTVQQQERIQIITNQLPVLWDEERRERAMESRTRPVERTFSSEDMRRIA